jgi:hypothetical protein
VWNLYDELIAAVPEDSTITECVAGIHWFAARSAGMGMALNPHFSAPTVAGAGSIAGRKTREVAEWVKSWDFNRAAIGLAAINSALNGRSAAERNCGAALDAHDAEDSFEYWLEEMRGKKVGVIGHFRKLERVAAVAELTILERRPEKGDLPDPACEYVLPSQDFVFITGSALINKTLPRLLELSRNARVALIGPSTPLHPLLLKHGIEMLGGLTIDEPELPWRVVQEGGHHEILSMPGLQMVKVLARSAVSVR